MTAHAAYIALLTTYWHACSKFPLPDYWRSVPTTIHMFTLGLQINTTAMKGALKIREKVDPPRIELGTLALS